jgi:hypothetical protein
MSQVKKLTAKEAIKPISKEVKKDTPKQLAKEAIKPISKEVKQDTPKQTTPKKEVSNDISKEQLVKEQLHKLGITNVKIMPKSHKMYNLEIGLPYRHYVKIETAKDLDTGELIDHAKKFGFRAVLINIPDNNIKKYKAKYLCNGKEFKYEKISESTN